MTAVSRTRVPVLHAYDLLCFGSMAAVGVGVVLNMGFMQASDMAGLGEPAGRLVLASVLAALAFPGAVLLVNMVRKAAPILFFAALAIGSGAYLTLAIFYRLALTPAGA